MILGAKGGEEIAAVMNRDENLELLQFKRGAMTGSLEKKPDLDDKIMKTFSATAREILKSVDIDENLMPSTQNILKYCLACDKRGLRESLPHHFFYIQRLFGPTQVSAVRFFFQHHYPSGFGAFLSDCVA
jgi:hypothetical protein